MEMDASGGFAVTRQRAHAGRLGTRCRAVVVSVDVGVVYRRTQRSRRITAQSAERHRMGLIAESCSKHQQEITTSGDRVDTRRR